MCSFTVDSSTGVLSRTGGTECGSPGCGFLSLSGKGITSIAEGAFAGMVHLQVLDLSINSISNISHHDLMDLVSLKTLNLRENRITQLYNGTFWGLSSVENISLDHNWLSSIEPGAFQGLSSVQSLSLVDNQLSFISTGTLEGLSSLRDLDLSNNNLGNMTAPGTFSGMPELRRLTIRWQHSSSFHFGKDTFAGNFSQLADLSISICWWCGITPTSTIELGAFDGLTGLQSLLLYDSGLESASLPAGLFLHSRSLVTLSLSGNSVSCITEDTFAGLEDNLESLSLHKNRITEISGKAFYRFKRIRYLILSSNLISVLPVDIFSSRLFNSTDFYVSLVNNPLLCQPDSPGKGFISTSLSTLSLPRCPPDVSFRSAFF